MYQKPVYSPHIPYWRRLFVRVRNLTGENRSYWPRLTLGCTLSPSLDLRKIFLPLVVKEEEEEGKKRVNLLSTFFHLIHTHHPLIYKRSFSIYEHPGVIRQTVPTHFFIGFGSICNQTWQNHIPLFLFYFFTHLPSSQIFCHPPGLCSFPSVCLKLSFWYAH